MQPYVLEKHFETAEAFLDALRPWQETWTSGKTFANRWIFRGQSDAGAPLVPSLYREPKKGSLLERCIDIARRQCANVDWPLAYKERDYQETDPIRIERLKHWGTLRVAEVLAVREFVALSDSVGHPIGISNDLRAFTPSVPNVSILKASPGLELAIAQHHGIPTSLLDWTRNPLVAAYFAAEGHARASIEFEHGTTGLVVWALDTSIENYDWISTFGVPSHQIPFLRAQNGLFTHSRKMQYEYLKSGEMCSLESLLVAFMQSRTDIELRSYMQKFTLSSALGPRLLELLWRERISRAHLMPTFDHVSKAIDLMTAAGLEFP